MEQKIEALIAQNLIELRKGKGLKQSELSEAIGYSDKTISRWENGTSVPDIATLVKIAEFYNVTLEDLTHENAVIKSIEEEKIKSKETIVNDAALLSLSALTVWLVAAIIYIGFLIIRQFNFWQSFIYAIPISAYLPYRNISKHYNIKWLNFVLLTLITCGIVTAFYLSFIQYNLWQLFLLLIPMESMVVISTFFKKKGVSKSWKKRQ